MNTSKSHFIVIAFIKMLFLQITQKFPVEIYLRQNLSKNLTLKYCLKTAQLKSLD